MAPALGPILTSTPDLPALERAMAAMRADVIKVVTGWGLPGGWTSAARQRLAAMAPSLIVRTVAGDPSAAGPRGDRIPYPYANQVMDEVLAWARHRPDLTIEIGNEPLNGPTPLDPWDYAYHLGETITAIRSLLPRARILAPAFSLNERYTADLPRWLGILAPHIRRCHGVAIHAYSSQELAHGRALASQFAADRPIWLTEVNLAGDMDDRERARRLWALVAGAGLEAALVYHLDASTRPSLAEQGPDHYRLAPETLSQLGLRDEPLAGNPPPAPPRPPVISVPMTRERLTRGRALGPPRVLVLHATAGRFPSDFNWLRQGGGNPPLSPVSCHYYVDKRGAVSQFVADHDTAWHTGASAWSVDGRWTEGSFQGVARLNWLALGIELENKNDARDPYPAAQIDAAVTLARHLVRLYRIPRSQLVRHLDIAPGRKTDPAGFPWLPFVLRVYAQGDG